MKPYQKKFFEDLLYLLTRNKIDLSKDTEFRFCNEAGNKECIKFPDSFVLLYRENLEIDISIGGDDFN